MAQLRFHTTHKQDATSTLYHRAKDLYGDEQQEGFHISSKSIDSSGRFLRQCTSDGSKQHHDMSPEVSWHGLPEGTEALALVMEDVDAPEPEATIAPFTHW